MQYYPQRSLNVKRYAIYRKLDYRKNEQCFLVDKLRNSNFLK